MPPLNKMIRAESPEGFVQGNPERDPREEPRIIGSNPYIRCPLPPFNAGPDTLRQFASKVPNRRLIPLPAPAYGTGGSVNNSKTTIIQNPNAGGPFQSQLTATSATINAPALAPGQKWRTTVLAAKSFQLLNISSKIPVEIRLYSNKTNQSGDIVRLTDTAVPFEVVPGIITDLIFDTPPYQWTFQNRMGVNADSPQGSNLYVTIINPARVGTSAGVVVIGYLPLQNA